MSENINEQGLVSIENTKKLFKEELGMKDI